MSNCILTQSVFVYADEESFIVSVTVSLPSIVILKSFRVVDVNR